MTKTLFGLLLGVGLLVQTGCSESGPTQSAAVNGSTDAISLASIESMPKQDSTVDVADGLAFMREEEKVARDVYIALGQKWNLRVFTNITRSEQKHMDALKLLLDRYGLADPVGTNAEGVFVNQTLQQLYTDLVAQGSLSAKDALLVGKLVEETDIRDLDTHQAGLDAGSDIYYVYQNLKRGSENHLRAFTNNLLNQP